MTDHKDSQLRLNSCTFQKILFYNVEQSDILLITLYITTHTVYRKRISFLSTNTRRCRKYTQIETQIVQIVVPYFCLLLGFWCCK